MAPKAATSVQSHASKEPSIASQIGRKRRRQDRNARDEERLLLALGYGPLLFKDPKTGRSLGYTDQQQRAIRRRRGHLKNSWHHAVYNESTLRAETHKLRTTKGKNIAVPDIAKAHGLPHGGQLIHTSAVGLLCSLNSLINSIKAQFPHWHSPTIDVLQALVNTPEAQEFNETAGIPGLDSTNNLRADQIGLILKEWGLKQRPQLHLQLGVIVEGRPKPTIPPIDNFPDTEYVWVYNDGFNLEDDDDQDGNIDIERAATMKIGHYSGIAPKLPTSQAPARPLGGTTQNTPGTTPHMDTGKSKALDHTDPDGYIKERWQELDKRIKSIIQQYFPDLVDSKFTTEKRFKYFRAYSPMAATFIKSQSYRAHILERHFWSFLAEQIFAANSKFWAGKDAGNEDTKCAHDKAKEFLEVQEGAYHIKASQLARSSDIACGVVNPSSRNYARIERFLNHRAHVIRNLYDQLIPAYSPGDDDAEDPVNIVVEELLATFWGYLGLTAGNESLADAMIEDAVNIVRCAAEIDIMMRVQPAQYVVFFPEVDTIYREETSSLLCSPVSWANAAELRISLAVTPTLGRITNFADPRMTATGNGYEIKAGVFCNLKDEDFKQEGER